MCREIAADTNEQNRSYLGATDGDVDRDLFVTADTEGTDSVTSLACSRLLGDLVSSQSSLFAGVSKTYCRQESDQTAARAPWRHE
jgi:hypothetical protein